MKLNSVSFFYNKDVFGHVSYSILGPESQCWKGPKETQFAAVCGSGIDKTMKDRRYDLTILLRNMQMCVLKVWKKEGHGLQARLFSNFPSVFTAYYIPDGFPPITILMLINALLRCWLPSPFNGEIGIFVSKERLPSSLQERLLICFIFRIILQ